MSATLRLRRVNRPVRTRMPGGVGGGASDDPAYPIWGSVLVQREHPIALDSAITPMGLCRDQLDSVTFMLRMRKTTPTPTAMLHRAASRASTW